MITVPSHQFKGTYPEKLVDSSLAFARNELGSRLSDNPSEAGGVHADAQLTRAGGAFSCGRPKDALELLHASCDAAGALFSAVAASPGTKVTFVYRGTPLTGPAGAAGFGCGPGPWITSLLVAAALGRADTVRALVQVPAQLLSSAPGERDACFLHLVYALQALVHGEDVTAPLAEFERLSRPEHLKIATPRTLERFRALAEALVAVAQADQAKFTAALVAMLKAHKAAFGKGKEAASHAYLIDIHSCGMARIGRDRGLQVEVESDYMPTWILNAQVP